ncbi:hypothetical protein CIW48_19570 [Methylobacterium sp. P1-11]|uniref:hypothetical protein n=1 Tax=Methylobacterium sp. P1-11 TaxID=2024616 RepID=UPI0011EC8A42|nr:hypothetical protein [Methylobacterium sp. P1-11]KAA0122199.1 hypothetical protein CIW48_19570 [Methylobacterium sp. P1-11]
MHEDDDPILEAAAALWASGVRAVPIGDELDRWQVGDLIFSDSELWRLAASRGLVEDGDSR